VRLPPELLEPFLQTMIVSLNASDLGDLLEEKLFVQRYVVMPEGALWDRQVRSAHSYFHRQNTTEKLVAVVREARPNEEAFRKISEALELASAASATSLAGLKTLTASARPIVAAHATELKRALRYTQLVAALKGLHDLLDQLRRSVFIPLRLIIERFPNSGSLMDLSHCLSTFGALQRNIAAIRNSAVFGAYDLPWVNEHLPIVCEQLKIGMSTREAAPLVEAAAILRTIVETELSALDSDLARAAQDLDFESLILQLRKIQDEAGVSGGFQAEILSIERDITVLEEISVTLSNLVKEHGAWQRVDNYLNLFETTMNESATALATPWLLVRTRLDALILRTAVIPGLAETAEDMGRAVAAGDFYEIVLKWPPLSTLVRDYFFQLDRSLLNECDRVAAIGEGLRAILERIDG
jgi:hypothetical protein